VLPFVAAVSTETVEAPGEHDATTEDIENIRRRSNNAPRDASTVECHRGHGRQHRPV